MTGHPRPSANIPFYAYPPDNYFLRAEHLVPIHIVRSLDENNTFIESLKAPTCKRWKRFLEELGYQPTERGDGRHVVWEGPRGFKDVTVNCHLKELDPRAFRSGLKNLDLQPKDFRSYLLTGKIPEKIHQRAMVR